MKAKFDLTFLRKESFSGTSAKTGKPYDITNLFFLDEEYKEVKLGVVPEFKDKLGMFENMRKYSVLLKISLGNYTNVDVMHADPIKS